MYCYILLVLLWVSCLLIHVAIHTYSTCSWYRLAFAGVIFSFPAHSRLGLESTLLMGNLGAPLLLALVAKHSLSSTGWVDRIMVDWRLGSLRESETFCGSAIHLSSLLALRLLVLSVLLILVLTVALSHWAGMMM